MDENLAGNIVSESFGDISILLIDHDIASVASLTSMLEQFSYKVTNVNVASEALPMIEKKKDIGLIIVNIEMPHIDSHSFVTALLHKDIPLILTSPENDTKEAPDLLTKGACFCLKKPISENDIKNLSQHVVSKKNPELEEINIAEKQDNVMDGFTKQIESFRETIKRQRTSQSSLLGRRRIINSIKNSDLYQKRRNVTNDEWKAKPIYRIETHNKRGEENKMESNVGRSCNLWTHERHMKFLAAISILGEKDSRPKSILKIMNDPKLNHRQVASHLQKYKSQVDRLNETLSRNEWKSTDKTFIYPSDYEYPFKVSNLTNNLTEINSLWNSLTKKKSSSSSIPQYSFKKPDVEKGKMPKFHLNGKLDLSNHPLLGNVLNKSCKAVNYFPSSTSDNPTYNIPSTNDVNHTGLVSTSLSSNNLPAIPSLPSSVGASSSSSFLIGSSRVCTPRSNLNPNPSTGLETVRNQIDIDPKSTSESYVPQANVYTMGESYSFLPEYTMNPFETIDHMGRIPSLENYSHHETNMNQMDWTPSTENYGIQETDMTITVSDSNTDHIGRCVSLGEGYVPSEHVIPLGSNTNQLGRVSLGENHVLSEDMIFQNTNTNHVAQIPSEANMIIPATDTNQMDWFLSEESCLLLENLTSLETSTTQVGLVSCERTSTALVNLIPQETHMEEVGFVPCEEKDDVPIEDLISFDTDVAEMDMDSWLESYGYSESNVPLSTSYIDYGSSFHTPIEDNNHSPAMHLGSTSQQEDMMESCVYQNTEADNQRESAEGGYKINVDDLESMDWLDGQ